MSLWRYQASARGPRAWLALALWWGVIALGVGLIGMSGWIAGALVAVSLPALWEALRGTTAWLEIDSDAVRWGSGRRAGRVPRDELARVRLDTRLDFSLRATLVLVNGKRIRLPYECVPRAARIKAALDAAGITHEHHHFSLMS